MGHPPCKTPRRNGHASLPSGYGGASNSTETGGNATATVRTARPTRCLVWPKEELKKLLRRNPTMDIAMNTVFSLGLARKLGGAPSVNL